MNPQEIARHIVAVKEVPATGGPYSIDLTQSGLKAGDGILLLGLADRDGTGQGFPRLTPGDLVGFGWGQDSFARVLAAGDNTGVDLLIDREIFEGQTIVSGRVLGRIESANLLIAAYAGELDSITDLELDFSKVLGFTEISGLGGNVSDLRYELPISPIGVPFPIKAYIMAFADSNANQRLDPGETVYFHSGRADKVPEKVQLTQGQGVTFDLNLNFRTQVPRGYAMPLAGSIDWQPADARSSQPAFVFVAKGDNIEAITQSPLAAIKYLKRLQR